MPHTVRSKWRLISDRSSLRGLILVAHKARILLQLALTQTSDLKEIQRIFNEY